MNGTVGTIQSDDRGLAAITHLAGLAGYGAEKKRIVTTFTIIQDMAQNVAGDAAIVESITKPGAEIHDYQPTPGDIVKARVTNADEYGGMPLLGVDGRTRRRCAEVGDQAAQGGGELPDQLRVIADVRFVGLDHLGKRELKFANIKTRRPSRLPWRERPALRLDYLRADTSAIVALYRHYGYLDARAQWTLESTRDPSAARVVFVIQEGERSRVTSVASRSSLQPSVPSGRRGSTR